MQITLDTEEAQLLLHHLALQLEHLDDELIHTDKRELQRELASDVNALRTLTDKIASSVERKPPTA